MGDGRRLKGSFCFVAWQWEHGRMKGAIILLLLLLLVEG